MSLNREQKRALKKRGELGEDGTPVATRRQPAGKPQQEERVGFRRYLSEVINYSIGVLVTLVVITSMIALMDWGFGEGLLKLFER